MKTQTNERGEKETTITLSRLFITINKGHNNELIYPYLITIQNIDNHSFEDRTTMTQKEFKEFIQTLVEII